MATITGYVPGGTVTVNAFSSRNTSGSAATSSPEGMVRSPANVQVTPSNPANGAP
jgi:hypothetical protein